MNKISDKPGLSRSGLAVLLAGQLLPLIDFSIVNVALDTISSSLKASPVQLKLVVATYGIAYAVSLTAGSRWGDNFGRRRVFAIGVVIFGIASLLCGLARSAWLLVIVRAMQGVGAALIVPQILATLHVCLQGKEHARAIGLYGGVAGLAFIIGQMMGGHLVTANPGGYGWRSVFLINIPLCIAILAFVHQVPETKKAARVPPDWAGMLLLTGTLGCLLMALALGPLTNWSWPCILMLAAFPLLLYQLWRVERKLEQRQRAPMLSPTLLRLPGIRLGLTMAVIFFSCFSGFMFTVALTLQAGLGMTSLQSGNAFIALGVSYFISSMFATRIVSALGKIKALILGCAIQMSGLLALAATFYFGWSQVSIGLLIPASLPIGAGQAFIVNCFYRIGLTDVPPEEAGAGSAILNTIMQAALGLGPMLMGTVFSEIVNRNGEYPQAITAALLMEWLMMLLLVIRTCCSHHVFSLQAK